MYIHTQLCIYIYTHTYILLSGAFPNAALGWLRALIRMMVVS